MTGVQTCALPISENARIYTDENNLIMGLLSVVVHGVRLNLLEFSGQLGMEWTGVAYKPFSQTAQEQ